MHFKEVRRFFIYSFKRNSSALCAKVEYSADQVYVVQKKFQSLPFLLATSIRLQSFFPGVLNFLKKKFLNLLSVTRKICPVNRFAIPELFVKFPGDHKTIIR